MIPERRFKLCWACLGLAPGLFCLVVYGLRGDRIAGIMGVLFAVLAGNNIRRYLSMPDEQVKDNYEKLPLWMQEHPVSGILVFVACVVILICEGFGVFLR